MENISRDVPANSAAWLNRRAAWALLLVFTLAALAIVFIPAFLIQPFRPQTGRGLEISYLLKSWSPVVTIILAASVVGLMLWLWRGARRWWRKAAMILLLLLTSAATWFARQNHFEWMFNPLANSSYVKASEASFVNESDMVLAVKFNNEAVAYPVRLMAYHHVVQDIVGGVPIVATY